MKDFMDGTSHETWRTWRTPLARRHTRRGGPEELHWLNSTRDAMPFDLSIFRSFDLSICRSFDLLIFPITGGFPCPDVLCLNRR